jgi:hypothetical protein
MAYQLDVINEAKEELRAAIAARKELQAKQWGLGNVEAQPLPSDEYTEQQLMAQGLINARAGALVDIMDVYTRNWK